MPEPGPRVWGAAKIVMSVALIAGAAAYLLGGSLRESLVYDRTVDQVVAQQRELTGEQIRVGGKLVPGSHLVAEGTSDHSFAIKGESETLRVRYSGLWPDAAQEGRELMVEGTLAPEGSMTATKVLARCPSRYKRRVSPDASTAPVEGSTPPR